MTKRLLISVLVILGAIGVANRFRPLSARAASNVIALQPIRFFQVQGVDGFRLNDIETYNGDLYLLLGAASGLNESLHLTGTGEILNTITLPPPPASVKQKQFEHLRISPSGTMAVSFPHSGPTGLLTTLFLYDTAGVPKSSFEAPFDDFAFLGDDLVGVGPTGFRQLTSQSQFVSNGASHSLAVLDPSTPVMTASLPQNKLAIVEIVAGRLQIATMNGLSVAPVVLNAPEIQGVERPSIENGWVAVISTVAASQSGSLYLGVTGGKRQEGAPVLQFDSSGVLKNRIKCVLPTFGQDPSDHQSYMYAGKLLATNDLLFWISWSEKKVAAYSTGDLH